ncbi:RNA polymerase sigma-H factor [Actinoplanes sp. SE50]|uniref:RNA polymerase sigma factor n=1 Tax=unclassified Actinoplanes TaxID=2626549 RepID=UPI00023EC128|nr:MULTISPECIES: sigma-70 family RNA polymerase sigma factor [unclassified Actinoplanes]AEV85788.1 RNA polymerase sigma-H factor [Actinoplanes sp. SE50/110]ATO84182.1 RNA polymerase sigma-H factor [Actinoplanes sp. SE50]SLM01592.1 RNA polymerase sigma-H factor [Actinoplanes sp. SE50/110]
MTAVDRPRAGLPPEPADLVSLVTAAAAGDEAAWNALVARYASLVYATCRRWRLTEADAADVSQTVWLRLVENLSRLREPQALPGWLTTTTARECTRLYHCRQREHPEDVESRLARTPADDDGPVDRDLIAAERDAALRAAFAELPEHCRSLLGMLMRDEPVPYAEISTRLSMPCGAIGPTRSRCLDRLRRNPALRALLTDAEGNEEKK